MTKSKLILSITAVVTILVWTVYLASLVNKTPAQLMSCDIPVVPTRDWECSKLEEQINVVQLTTKECTKQSIEATVQLAEITVQRDAKCTQLINENSAKHITLTSEIAKLEADVATKKAARTKAEEENVAYRSITTNEPQSFTQTKQVKKLQANLIDWTRF